MAANFEGVRGTAAFSLSPGGSTSAAVAVTQAIPAGRTVVVFVKTVLNFGPHGPSGGISLPQDARGNLYGPAKLHTTGSSGGSLGQWLWVYHCTLTTTLQSGDLITLGTLINAAAAGPALPATLTVIEISGANITSGASQDLPAVSGVGITSFSHAAGGALAGAIMLGVVSTTRFGGTANPTLTGSQTQIDAHAYNFSGFMMDAVTYYRHLPSAGSYVSSYGFSAAPSTYLEAFYLIYNPAATSPSGGAFGLSMIRTKAGRLLVAYGDNVAKKIRLNRYADDDATVAETIDIATVPDMPPFLVPPYIPQPIRGHHPKLAVAPDGTLYLGYSFVDFRDFAKGYIAFSRDDGETWTSLLFDPFPALALAPHAYVEAVALEVDRQGSLYATTSSAGGFYLHQLRLLADETAWVPYTPVFTGFGDTNPSDQNYPVELLSGRDRSLEIWRVGGSLAPRRTTSVGPNAESVWAALNAAPAFASQSLGGFFGVDKDPATGMCVIAENAGTLIIVLVARVNEAGTGLILSSGAGGFKSWSADNLIAVDVLRERDGSWRIAYWQGGVIRFKTCAAVAFDGSANWV